jgi:glyoxylase-like metal-dependent hydrolase (beta-lactamase superfamily II)
MPTPSDASWGDVLWIDTGSVNVYLCRDADGYTLIDTAMPGKADLVLARLAEWGGEAATLKRIVVTHADIDHAGSAAELQARTGALVYAGAATAALLAEGRSPRHMPRLAQFVIDRFVRYKAVDRAALRLVGDGDELPALGGLRVLAAPGHTPDQQALFSPAAGVLFAADALNTRDGRLQLTPRRITADQAAAERTASRMLQLSPAVIACGHGAPLVDAQAAGAELRARLPGATGGQP